jgi:hypothetical protein
VPCLASQEDCKVFCLGNTVLIQRQEDCKVFRLGKTVLIQFDKEGYLFSYIDQGSSYHSLLSILAPDLKLLE